MKKSELKKSELKKLIKEELQFVIQEGTNDNTINGVIFELLISTTMKALKKSIKPTYIDFGPFKKFDGFCRSDFTGYSKNENKISGRVYIRSLETGKQKQMFSLMVIGNGGYGLAEQVFIPPDYNINVAANTLTKKIKKWVMEN